MHYKRWRRTGHPDALKGYGSGKSLKERFEEKFEREGPDECWLWTGAKDDKGYGVFYCDRERGSIKTHRVSYELYVGPVPEDTCVCHSCDVPACVNPGHLWPGTKADNNHDMDRKGRRKWSQEQLDRAREIRTFRRGEEHHQSKVTDDDVREIRRLYLSMNASEIAALYGIGPSAAWRIATRRTWRHVK